jgi:serine/threonine-protein kinase
LQIADGLDAAHQRDVIHRDLKPANVKLTTEGRAKVLDFGLAKLVSDRASGTAIAHDITASPTIAIHVTREGHIVGTIAYMSPEQARGQAIDARTDIWAFGCVLFEMLTGRVAFSGDTATDILAAIVEREPRWEQLPDSVPLTLRAVIRRCLDKNPARRFRDIGDVRFALEDTLIAPAARVDTRRFRWVIPATAGVLTGLVAAGAVAWLTIQRRGAMPTPAAAVSRLVIVPDDGLSQELGSCAAGGCGSEAVLAVSPDGRQVVYSAGSGNRQRLFLRAIDRFESQPIPGTEGGRVPTFSPDGRGLAFIAARKLKRVSLDGGAPVVLREFIEGDGLDWSDDGNIYFSTGLAAGLWRVPAAGGQSVPVTTIVEELQHRFPDVLPGGSAIVYSGVTRPTGTGEQIMVERLGTGQRKVLTPGAAPHYLPTGHLLYVLSGQLLAVRFDVSRLEIIGTPSVVVDSVEQTLNGTPQYAVSPSGTLLYVPGSRESEQSALVWVRLDGTETPTNAAGRPYVQPRLSPDSLRVAMALRGNASDVWEYDLTRGTSKRLTFDALSSFPVWTPDGRRLTFSSGKDGASNIYWKMLDGSEPETRLVPGDRANLPLSWSPDGKQLAFVSVDPQTAQDIWIFDRDDQGKSKPFIHTPFGEGAPAFSPDGRWLAYVSNESGRNEIYVQPFPGPGAKLPISTNGGNEPVWAKNASLLFYRDGDAMMVVDVRTTPQFFVGKPRLLFERPYERSNAFWPDYDVTPDGQRLLMLKSVDRAAPPRQIDVVFNWFEELKQRVP